MLSHRLSRVLAVCSALGIASLGLAPLSADALNVYKVGGDAACPYSTIQEAVDAAAANPGADDVWIAMNQSYSGQQVIVSDQDVVIEGGFVDCNDIDIDTALTTVSGAGNAGGAVFSIRGNSNVYLGNMLITGANRDGDASGGGIDFDGIGTLTLQQLTVTNNSAGYGGGMNVKGDGGHVDVTLGHDTLFLTNTAGTSGGGIRVEGDTHLLILQPNTLIGFNHAPNGYGGGIEVLGPAYADIGSPGYNTGAVIQFNDAQFGGGIAAIAPDSNQDVSVQLFTTDANNPVQVANNIATEAGGGIYARPFESTDFSDSTAEVCAFDARLNNNVASEGAAVYADQDNTLQNTYIGAYVWFNPPNACGPVSPPTLGAVACAPTAPCNEISGNTAADNAGEPTDGSILFAQTAAFVIAERSIMRGNSAAHLLRTRSDNSGGGQFSNALLADNVLSAELISMDDADGSVGLHNCTITHNEIGAPFVILARGVFSFSDSIIDQPGRSTVDFVEGPLFEASYLLSNDVSTLGSGAGLIQGAPAFVDGDHGDYHLQATSLGVDFAPALDNDPHDLDRLPRVVDLPDIPNGDGPMDLGAYEIQASKIQSCSIADTIFCDGFDP